MTKRSWTASDDDRLRELRARGMFFSQIAREMGITKNSAIGRLNRIGLIGDRALPRLPRWAPLTRAFEAIGRKDCRWPIGDPRTRCFSFCGQPIAGVGGIGRSYCAQHARLAVKQQ